MAQLLPSPFSCPPFIHSFPTYFLHAFSLPSAQPWRNTDHPPWPLSADLAQGGGGHGQNTNLL